MINIDSAGKLSLNSESESCQVTVNPMTLWDHQETG